MTDQCSSCGGFCGKRCLRENVEPQPAVGFGTPGRSIAISYELFNLMKELIKELKQANFQLAAGHCIVDGGSGLTAYEGGTPYCAAMKRIAELESALAVEREECAKVADAADKYNRFISREIAAAIRARGNT